MKRASKFYVALLSFCVGLVISIKSLSAPLFICMDSGKTKYSVNVVNKADHSVSLSSEDKSLFVTGTLQGVVQLNTGFFKMLSADGQTIFLIGTDSNSSTLSGFLNTEVGSIEISCRSY